MGHRKVVVMNHNTRAVAQVLVDLYSGYIASEDDDDEGQAFATAMERLNSVDAVTATMDDNDELTLDFTPILTASNAILMWVLDRLMDATGETEDALLFDLRTFLERLRE